MNLLAHAFDDLTEADAKLLDPYFTGFPYNGADYTLLSNYIWRAPYRMRWEIVEDLLWLSSCVGDDPAAVPVTSMPLTRTGGYDSAQLRASVLAVKARFDAADLPLRMAVIPGHMVPLLEAALPGEMTFSHDRDADEYVYLKEKLITLSGRALHRKKNHMNYFLRTYDYEVRSITPDMAETVLDFVERTEASRAYGASERETLDMERTAIREMLRYTDAPQVYTAAVFVRGELQAFAIGERLSADTAAEHFEKANEDYRGLYQVVCSEFCRRLPEEVRYVNREEDMGLENLRQAKEALKPDHMEKKYLGCFLLSPMLR